MLYRYNYSWLVGIKGLHFKAMIANGRTSKEPLDDNSLYEILELGIYREFCVCQTRHKRRI